MKFNYLKISILLLMVMLCAPPCFAKAKANGFFYVVGYSFKDKVVYSSAIFVAKTRDCSYSEEEYCTDVEVLQKIEAAFEKHIGKTLYGKLSRFTFSARGGYKSFAIAKKKLDAEIDTYTNRKMTVEYATDFIFNN